MGHLQGVLRLAKDGLEFVVIGAEDINADITLDRLRRRLLRGEPQRLAERGRLLPDDAAGEMSGEERGEAIFAQIADDIRDAEKARKQTGGPLGAIFQIDRLARLAAFDGKQKKSADIRGAERLHPLLNILHQTFIISHKMYPSPAFLGEGFPAALPAFPRKTARARGGCQPQGHDRQGCRFSFYTNDLL